jgi:soluble lytic murein transglycosylase-like protein
MKKIFAMLLTFWPVIGVLSLGSEIVIFQEGKYLEIERHEEKEDHYILFFKGGQVSCPKSAVSEIRLARTREIIKSEVKKEKSNNNEDYKKIVDDLSGRYDVDPSLVKAIIKVESNYNPNAVSPKGAKGLMQLMPATADRFKAKDIFDVHENIEAGIKYLKFLFDKYNDRLDLVLAAYNAGEEAVDQYNGIPPYSETVDYVVKVCDIYGAM